VLDSKNYSEFATFVENYGEKFSKHFGKLLIIYDPVSTKAYERVDIDVEAPIQSNIEMTIKNLVKIVISSKASKPFTLIVLPSDVYNALSGEMRNTLEGYRLDVSQGLINTEFLAELIREYSKTKDKPNGCALSDDVLSKLTGELAKFNSGGALIARLIGEELARNNCGVGKIEELINSAKGKAEAFIILHINGLFKVHENPDTAKALVEIFALRRPFVDDTKPGDPIMTPGIIELISRDKGASLLRSAKSKELRSWLARRQHDLIEEAIGMLLDCIGEKGEKCKVLGDALEPWKTIEVIELLKKVSEKVRDVDSAVKYFASNYGEKLTNTLKVFSNECWKRAAYIIGHALAGDPIMPGHREVSAFLHLSKTGIQPLRDELSRLGVDDDELRLIISLTEYNAKYYASIVASLGDALKKCDIDDYLIVYDEIPPLIMELIMNHTSALAGVFINKYDEAIAEIKRLLNIIKNRREIYDDEAYYSLGLATIIVKATESGMPVGPSDADAALHIASFAMSHVLSTHHIIRILSALAPLRDKAPHRYLEVLALALNKVSPPFLCPNWDTVMNILNEFDHILKKYGDGAKEYAWTLIHAIDALTYSLYKCLKDCDDYTFEDMNMDTSFRTELEHVVSRVAGLLDKINRLNPSLDIIAWSYALLPALENKCVRALMESVLGIDVVNKAIENARKLSGLRGSVQELIREDFKGFVESWLAETGENTTREILEKAIALNHVLAQYKLNSEELDEAERLFNEAAVESREIGDYVNYLDSRHWALRVEAIKGRLVGDDLVKLVNGFRQLYEEAVDAERLMPASPYNGTLSKRILRSILRDILRDILGGYLVSLALTGGDEEIRRIEELLKEQWQVLGFPVLRPTLTRLALNALLSPRVGLSGELRDRLVVKPGEIIVALGLGYIDINSLPALKATYGTIKPGDEKRLCEEIDDPIIHDLCVKIVSRDYSEELDQQAGGNFRQAIINHLQEWISKEEVLDLLKKLGLNAELLNDELKRLIHELSGKSLVSLDIFSHCFEHEQLRCSLYQLTYMLYALINGNEKLAKAHALAGAMIFTEKLPAKLFLEAYRACCDPNNEEFRRAIAKLFFYHI
jgi:hypothetical protein